MSIMGTPRTAWWQGYKVDVPCGERGDIKIDRFTITEEGARSHNLSSIMSGAGSRQVQPGTYTRISRGHTLWMTDTPAEIADHLGVINEVRRRGGRVLIHGLGIGLVLNAILREGEGKVEEVDVVEINPDVIALVGPHYQRLARRKHIRLNIIEGDAYTYRFPPGTRWTVAWHDIWPKLSEDNLPQMATLKRRYARATDWQGCWGQAFVRYMRDRRR